jgi:hypothetical protein
VAPERFFVGSAAAINAAAPLQPDMVRPAAQAHWPLSLLILIE